MIKINVFNVKNLEDAFGAMEYENYLLGNGYSVHSVYTDGYTVKIGVPDGEKPLTGVEAVKIAKEFLATESARGLL